MKPWHISSVKPRDECLSRRIARNCELVVAHVAHHRKVHSAAILAPTRRDGRTAGARQLAMYLCHVTLELSMADVGRFFGRDRTTVSHACARIENMRDDRTWDAAISAIEIDIALARSCRRLASVALAGCLEFRHE